MHLVLPSSYVSRNHAAIVCENGDFCLKDMGSLTGTFLSIPGSILLELGMVVRFGDFFLTVTSLTAEQNVVVLSLNEEDPVHYELKAPCFIGKEATCGLIFASDKRIAPVQAAIELEAKGLVLRDLAQNGL
jgi:hypothetical protein